MERLCYWSEIASNLRFGFYSSPEQLRTDLLTMINNSYLLCANREKKEMLSKNAEYLALLLSDLWRVLRLRDGKLAEDTANIERMAARDLTW